MNKFLQQLTDVLCKVIEQEIAFACAWATVFCDAEWLMLKIKLGLKR